MVIRQTAYDGIVQKLNSPLFSPDSTHVAYVAMNDKRMFMVEDGKKGKNYEHDFFTFV